MKNFAIIGAAGFIAPRHLKAIKETGNNLLAALDPHDSVGILDQYFPNADFFTEFERFDRHLDKLKRKGKGIDYLVICSPNYLHDAHIRFGLRIGANVICEKPIVLNPWNIDGLIEMERETGKNVYSIQQLRLHPAIISLKEKVDAEKGKKYKVDLEYITARGNWYQYSWKGDSDKSGGIASNIGIHFFDMLIWIFGSVQKVEVKSKNEKTAEGVLELESASVNWQLSIDKNLLPDSIIKNGLQTFRSIKVDGEEIEFSNGFEDLHTQSYKEILKGNGFRINESRAVIDLIHQISNK